jgi:hypothetical protein
VLRELDVLGHLAADRLVAAEPGVRFPGQQQERPVRGGERRVLAARDVPDRECREDQKDLQRHDDVLPERAAFEVGQEAEAVRPDPLAVAHGGRERAGQEDTVGVGQQQQLAGRVFGELPEGVGLPFPAGEQRAAAEHPDAGVAREVLGDPAGAVVGMVVEDQDLQRSAVILREQRSDTRRKRRRLVPGRDQHRQRRPGSRGRAARSRGFGGARPAERPPIGDRVDEREPDEHGNHDLVH